MLHNEINVREEKDIITTGIPFRVEVINKLQ